MVAASLKKSITNLLGQAKVFARLFDSDTRAHRSVQAAVESRLAEMALEGGSALSGPAGKCLIDGMWYNANYWYRLSLFRAAMGTVAGEEIGILGPHNAGRSRRTFAHLGIDQTRSFPELLREVRQEAVTLADRALLTTADAEDVLLWEMPMGFPAVMIYDGILKRQRAANVDVKDPNFREYVIEAYASCLAAIRLIKRETPTLLLLSHAVNFSYAALGWAAMKQGCPAVVLFGGYGSPRFFKLSCPDDFFNWCSGLTNEDIALLPLQVKKRLGAAGEGYLAGRLAGMTNDIGGQYAFGKTGDKLDRRVLAARYGWSLDTPIVAVYSSNFFDFPHACGMSHFRDFRDWLEVTISAAIENTNVNWLFKPHPCDAWYGGVTLSDLLPAKMPSHIAQLPIETPGADLLSSVDALITVHGTAGLEFAAQGKPVLLADRGWYDLAGFSVAASSRAEYAKLLRTDWWRQLNPAVVKERAKIFSGVHFCAPDWQLTLLMRDDSQQDNLWKDILMVVEKKENIDIEFAMIRKWMASNSHYYHNYKMMQSEEYCVANVESSGSQIKISSSAGSNHKEILQ